MPLLPQIPYWEEQREREDEMNNHIQAAKKVATVEGRVAQYVKLRDMIRKMEEDHKQKITPFKDTLEQLGSWLLAQLDQQKVESARTNAGTVYRSIKRSASIADENAFWTYVITSGNFDLLDKRANITAVADFIAEQTQKAKTDPNVQVGPPPGINYQERFTVGVRRA